MATHDSIHVSALRILDGERLENEPEDLGNIGIYQGQKDKGTLYVLVNAKGERHEEMEGAIVDAVIAGYQDSPSSVTGALHAGIKQANALVYADNEKSFEGDRTRAGVYCAVVRPGQDVVLGYAGPAAAVLIGRTGVERLFSDLDEEAVRKRSIPLGATDDISIPFYTCSLHVGERLALASPELLAAGLNDADLADVLTTDGLASVSADRDLTILLLTHAVGDDEHTRAIPLPEAPEPKQADERGASAIAAARSALQSAAQGLKRVFGARPAQQQSAPSPAPASHAAPPTHGPDAVLPAWLDRGYPDAAPAPRGRYQRAKGQIQKSRLPVSARQIALLAGIVVLIVGALWWQQRSAAQALEKKYQTFISQAEEKRVLGQASPDRIQALVYLKDAEALTNEALTVKPAANAALALRDNIRRDMDVAKGVTRLDAAQVVTLYTFSAAGAGPSRIVGDGYNLYVLDKDDQKVYKFVLNPQGNGIMASGDSVLVRKGDQIGGVVVGDLVDIAWIPAGGARTTANLCVLESGGNLIQYDVSKGLKVLPVRDARTWRKAQATGGYSGNFYVLDNLANTILRYRADSAGYTTAPTAYMQSTVDLASAVDMAIDGDIFVLMVNGQITWLSGGKTQAFSIQGMDQALAAPVALFTNDGSQSLYVADPANTRVVKLSKQGVTQKQLVYEDTAGGFQRLRGLFADEKKLALYVTAGTKLLYIALPN